MSEHEQQKQHECAPVSPLMASILGQMSRDAQFTTNALIDGLEYQEAHLRATLELIRAQIFDLLDGPYMPMPILLKKALYPPEEIIQERMRANGYKKRGH